LRLQAPIVGGAGGAEFIATIVDHASTQVLRVTMPPGSSIITDQNTMAYMSGHLKTAATMGGSQEGGGWLNAFKRSITGESFLINQVVNNTNETGEMTLAPQIPSAIAEVVIAPGEEWKVYPGSVLAATSNVRISGNINPFGSILTSFVTDTATYSTVSVPEGTTPGKAWICGFGGVEKRDITPSSIPFVMNNGTFLAMPLRYWDKYVNVGHHNTAVGAFVTDIGLVMTIQGSDSDPTPPTFSVYMQPLNLRNYHTMIKQIAGTNTVKKNSGFSFSAS
jgi:uncharacterized protein (AIM24 family)